jgi:N-acylneuraminate cytidylyltransferase
MKQLVIIPARKGSKGLPGKNLKVLNGKPLIQYTIELARKLFPDDIICVSTDDEEIIQLTESLGLKVHFKRPQHLSTDNSSTNDVILHAINYYETKFSYSPEIIILLQPTSPFRMIEDVSKAISLFNLNCHMVVSVKETKSNPYYLLYEENENGYLEKLMKGSFHKRQDCPKVYELNGAVYIINAVALKSMKISEFNKILKIEMDQVSSLDIDDSIDWTLAELISSRF